MKRFQLASLLFAPLFCLQAGAADAMVLEGNVRQSDYKAAVPLTRAEALSSNQSGQLAQLAGTQAVAVAQQVNPYQAAAERRAVRAQVLNGRWICTTQVTSSSAPGIVPGTQVQSMVSYVPNARGQMLELCEQDGWSPTSAAVVDLSSDTMFVKRTSCSASRGAAISAQTKDAMKIVSPNVIAATSLVHAEKCG